MTVPQGSFERKESSRADREFSFFFYVLAAGGLAAPTTAQSLPVQNDEIIVIGQRQDLVAGAERSINAADMSAYGLSTVGELIDEIAIEEGESAGDVEILINGRLSRGRSSIEDYPPEAVERIDVLAPGAAGKSGGSNTARAINIVLRPQSRVLAARGTARAATEGGWGAAMGDLGLTAIDQPRRINVTARVTSENSLLESERGIDQELDAPDGLGRLRTLRGARDRFEVGFSASDQPTSWLNASLNVKLARADTDARLGLSAAGDPLMQRARSNSAAADLQLEATRGDWLLTMDAVVRDDRQRVVVTAPIDSAARKTSRSTSRDRSVELRANGPIADLPAGQIRLTVGGSWNRNSIAGQFDSVANSSDQTTRELRLGVDLPIASKASGFASQLGELGIGAELRRGRVSDLGSISSNSFTLRWEPATWLRTFGAVTSSRSQPSIDLLAATPIETPGVRYFDPVMGETVDVVTLSGGNVALGKFGVDSRSLSVRLQPFRNLDLVLNGDYIDSDTRNVIAVLPPASEAVINAFPDRFIRDSGGRLIAVDLRPVTFDRQSESQLRQGINLIVPVAGKDRPGRGGRIQLSASHTFLISSRLTIGEGGPTFDLLSRRAAGFGGATRPRHQFDINLGYAERGLGLRVSVERRSASFLDLGGVAAGDALTFEPLTTFGFRAFAEAGRLLPTVKWLRGGRFTLTAVNLTNDRESVRDRSGFTPLAYQPGYRDPIGRTIELELRKTF